MDFTVFAGVERVVCLRQVRDAPSGQVRDVIVVQMTGPRTLRERRRGALCPESDRLRSPGRIPRLVV
ncbi:MAG: hypothetical protein KBI47_22005, partial [Armatimonadetes bacterium]|nr:hypothetical protein [Armatimonadota bacterium]